MRRIGIKLLLLYLAWCALLYVAQDRLIFPSSLSRDRATGPWDPNTVVLHVTLDDGGTVEGWFIPAPGVSAAAPGPVAVVFHGNGEVIDTQADKVRGYHALGCSVFLPEYRGYGRSAGRPSERPIVADCVRFYDRLLERPEVDKTRVVFHGRSLGGGVASAVAALRKPTVLLLGSTFTSLNAMARRFGVPGFLVRHPFRTDRVLADLDIPILISHGTHDHIIPVAHGRTLRDIAKRVQYYEYDRGHTDFPAPGPDALYWGRIRDFLVENGIITKAARQRGSKEVRQRGSETARRRGSAVASQPRRVRRHFDAMGFLSV